MELSRHLRDTLSPAEIFACLYAVLSAYGEDVRSFDAFQPQNRVFQVNDDPSLKRQLTADIAIVECMIELACDIAEQQIGLPVDSVVALDDRRAAAALLDTAQDCLVHLARFVRVVSPSQPTVLTLWPDWTRLKLRLMAPWS